MQKTTSWPEKKKKTINMWARQKMPKHLSRVAYVKILSYGGVEMSEELKEEYRNETMRLIKLIGSGKRLRSLYAIALQMAEREEKERDECEN